ncbi:PilW family protein [Craterilacuibacter sinensis]|nr:PilW family protein [Craterilacuibacter sinensis]
MLITKGFKVSRQQGLTLIELMIALTLGLFVVLVVGQVFLSSKTAWRNQLAQADLQEKGRFATRWINQQLAQAGYVDISRIAAAGNFPASGSYVNTAVISAASGTSTLSMRYWGNTEVVDCTGAAVASGTLRSQQISLASGTLSCDNTAVLAGVQQLVMTYGEDTDAAADGLANSYRAAGNVGNWARIRAIRICMLIQSDLNSVQTTRQILNDCNGNSYSVPNNRLARVFRSTVYLRNAPGGPA